MNVVSGQKILKIVAGLVDKPAIIGMMDALLPYKI
jgi:hypothetical protein